MTLYEQLNLDKEYRKEKNKKYMVDIIIVFIMFFTIVLHLIPISRKNFTSIIFKVFFVTYAINLYMSPFYYIRKSKDISKKVISYSTKFTFIPINKKIFIQSKIIILLKFSIKVFLLLVISNTIGIIIDKIPLLSFDMFFPLIVIGASIFFEIFTILLQYRKL